MSRGPSTSFDVKRDGVPADQVSLSDVVATGACQPSTSTGLRGFHSLHGGHTPKHDKGLKKSKSHGLFIHPLSLAEHWGGGGGCTLYVCYYLDIVPSGSGLMHDFFSW